MGRPPNSEDSCAFQRRRIGLRYEPTWFKTDILRISSTELCCSHLCVSPLIFWLLSMTATCYVLGCVLLGCNMLRWIVLTFVHLVAQHCPRVLAGVQCQCWIDASWLRCRNVSRVMARTEGTMRCDLFLEPGSRAHRTESGKRVR